jgi:hypothetical protein
MYYVYVHYKPSGEPFYVGKGTKTRAFTAGKRSLGWTKIVEECGGLDVRVIKYFETENESFEFEKQLIKELRQNGHELINATEGGRGPNGHKQSLEVRMHKSILMVGYKHKTIVCNKCGTSGGETSMKRWHFEKCTGAKIFKSRTTVNGKRVFLGNYATKEEANMVAKRFKAGTV